MNFEKLKHYLLREMRMSHIYQPAMIKVLLQKKGQAKITDIAKEFLKYDGSQIEYYEHIVKNMPGKVLTKNGIVTKQEQEYKLILDGEILNANQIAELIDLCNTKIDEYIAKRGDKIWSHL